MIPQENSSNLGGADGDMKNGDEEGKESSDVEVQSSGSNRYVKFEEFTYISSNSNH